MFTSPAVEVSEGVSLAVCVEVSDVNCLARSDVELINTLSSEHVNFTICASAEGVVAGATFNGVVEISVSCSNCNCRG